MTPKNEEIYVVGSKHLSEVDAESNAMYDSSNQYALLDKNVAKKSSATRSHKSLANLEHSSANHEESKKNFPLAAALPFIRNENDSPT